MKRGIVPIREEATILSTYISLRLIKLKGRTFPKIATPKISFLLFEKILLKNPFLQKHKRKSEAMKSL